MVPSSMVSRRLIARHSVDLPDPLGPMTTTTSPRFTVVEMSLRTCRSPKCLLTWDTTTRGSPTATAAGEAVSAVGLCSMRTPYR
jgi:hypothetical protein